MDVRVGPVLSRIVLGLFVTTGCQNGPTAKSPNHWAMLSENEVVEATEHGGFGANPDFVYVKAPISSEVSWRAHLGDRGLYSEWAYFPNPGIQVWRFSRKTDGRPLDEADREAIRKAAGHDVVEDKHDLEIKPVCGPDGKTPLVMKPVGRIYNDEGEIPDVPLTLHMSFDTEQGAKAALEYFDPRTYKGVLKGKEKGKHLVEVHWVGNVDKGREWKDFERIGNQFGGKVDFVSE